MMDMDTRSRKLNPMQGVVLLFLLLVIPVGIYMYQTQNVGETRSQAAPTGPAGWLKVIGQRRQNPALPLNPQQGTGNSKISTPTPTRIPTSTPTPTIIKSIIERCNTVCTSDVACGEGMVCTQEGGSGKCRNAQCYGVEDCWCYKTASPTPTPSCNSTCASDEQCGASMICVKTASGNKCRNPQCFGVEDCLCYTTLTSPTPLPTSGPTPTGYEAPTPTDYYYPVPTARIITVKATATPTPTPPLMLLADILSLSPTPLPFPTIGLLEGKTALPMLTIDPFYNTKKQTNPMIALSGTSDPDAQLDISIFPDGVITTVTADSLGNWTYAVPKKLPNGPKQLTIIARTQKGGQMTKTENFTVVGAYRFPTAAVVFSLLLALGVGGYILYQKKMAKESPPPANTPTTTEEFVGPQRTPTEEPTPQSFAEGHSSASQSVGQPPSVENPPSPAGGIHDQSPVTPTTSGETV